MHFKVWSWRSIHPGCAQTVLLDRVGTCEEPLNRHTQTDEHCRRHTTHTTPCSLPFPRYDSQAGMRCVFLFFSRRVGRRTGGGWPHVGSTAAGPDYGSHVITIHPPNQPPLRWLFTGQTLYYFILLSLLFQVQTRLVSFSSGDQPLQHPPSRQAQAGGRRPPRYVHNKLIHASPLSTPNLHTTPFLSHSRAPVCDIPLFSVPTPLKQNHKVVNKKKTAKTCKRRAIPEPRRGGGGVTTPFPRASSRDPVRADGMEASFSKL